MGNGSGVSRGDRNRNARLTRLRALVPVSNAIVGIDLADPGFWESGLALVEAQLHAAEAVAAAR